MRRLAIFTLLVGLLPLFALAEEAPAVADPTAPAGQCKVELIALPGAAEVQQPALGQPEPIALACTYSCPFCPFFQDLPPATCNSSGCCVYETQCEKTCDFDSDCGELSDCWSGCCMDFQH